MNNKILLIIGACLVITGAIMKVTHSFENWNDWVFRLGIIFAFIYLIFTHRKRVRS